ncbi:MAG: cupin domain-containing protein [Piscinibacter sp.]|uniref:cupin domain-containing protein n=1 Tax=Piscinibacter sp. TaxID=1903157 RepID=UPI00258A1C17|nr:cupin domain-containing protein [Piscinibacter sp.]MCW5662735.1 cupin domain-containing protein [Piscinibacter sp.]
MSTAPDRAAALIRTLGLQPHPEGGHYREWFRSGASVQPGDGRGTRAALTCIDFLLRRGEFSAWHRVASDELWHLLEGGPLRLWLMPPTLERVEAVVLGAGQPPRHAVPASWWQAAEPLGEFALCGASVAPGFEFADFAFARDDAPVREALQRLRPEALRLL